MNSGRLGPEAVERLTLQTEPWLSCDGCFRLVDQYVERLLAGEADTMPAMGVHLRACPACAEEAATLLELAAEDAGVAAPDLEEGFGPPAERNCR